MSRPSFTGEDVLKALTRMNYVPVDRTGSHAKLRYVHPETGEVRNVTVPIGGEIDAETLRSIADQCEAKDFDRFCGWIDRNR